MGMMSGDEDKFVVLTELEGKEDFNVDMDFKIADTRDGITSIQMDTKLKGLTLEIVEKTLNQGKEGRLFILDKMQQTIDVSRPEVSRYAPRMHKMMIDVSKIGSVIGTGGKTIRSIISETKTTIDINDDGMVIMGSADLEADKKDIAIIEGLTKDIEVGTI